DHDPAGPHVEAAAVTHRLSDAERNRDKISDQGRPQSDRDRHRQLVLDQIDDPAIPEKAVAEIKSQIIAQHQQEAVERRLVEAVLFFELLDQRRIETAGAAIAAVTAASLRFEFATLAADPLGRADGAALELGDHQLDRPS